MVNLNFENQKDDIINRLIDKGVCELHAKKIADCLTTADAYGVYSHGKATLDAHINRIDKGAYNLQPNIRVVRETSAFAVVDGDNSIGMVSADFCMKYAMEKCKQSGIFTVFSNNNNTFGPAFYYPLQAAQPELLTSPQYP
jgi:LDH2 family malate/lactate/ureidoglycolate dehydrogenase